MKQVGKMFFVANGGEDPSPRVQQFAKTMERLGFWVFVGPLTVAWGRAVYRPGDPFSAKYEEKGSISVAELEA